MLAHDIGVHARVLAGPGTGKSATLVALIDDVLCRVPAPRVRLLTFTRAATSELARKVSEHPAAAAEKPSTIHSFAISVLLRNPGVGDFPQPLRIADDWEYDESVVPTLARRARIQQRRVERLVREMAANWESLRPENDPRVDAEERARFHGAWNEHRRVYGYTLLAELPFQLRSGLRDHPDLAGVDFDLIAVDEYQDLNACDLDVLKLISERGATIIGAGDDDQSIYSFRRADPAGIRRFLQDYPNASDYTLSVSQRSGRRILEWALYVIQGDPGRPPKPSLRPDEGAPEGEAALLSFAGHVAEADGVAEIVARLREREGLRPEEVLVMVRGDHNRIFTGPVRRRLEAKGIVCSNPEALNELIGSPPNRRLIATLRLLVNSNDSLAWATLLILEGDIGPAFFDYVYERALADRTQFGPALMALHHEGYVGAPRSAAVARRVVDRILNWLRAHEAPPDKDREWGAWIPQLADDFLPRPSDQLAALLLELDRVVEQPITLDRFLGQVAPLGKDILLSKSAGVRLMTMAGSKGLTVRCAIVMAAEEGIIPRPDADIGEERRLLYVAMTRAQQSLFVTWARRRSGPTARAGRPHVGLRRRHTTFLDGGPVESQDGAAYLARR